MLLVLDMSEAPQIDAFVSYSREDKEDVKFVCNQLSQRGELRLFIDCDIEYGSSWLDVLAAQLHNAETFLFFIRSAPSKWQLRELGVAITKQVELGHPFIIPVLLPGMHPRAFFENDNLAFISRTQAAQFSSSTGRRKWRLASRLLSG
jgi:hypothetical protein